MFDLCVSERKFTILYLWSTKLVFRETLFPYFSSNSLASLFVSTKNKWKLTNLKNLICLSSLPYREEGLGLSRLSCCHLNSDIDTHWKMDRDMLSWKCKLLHKEIKKKRKDAKECNEFLHTIHTRITETFCSLTLVGMLIYSCELWYCVQIHYFLLYDFIFLHTCPLITLTTFNLFVNVVCLCKTV